MAKVVIAALDSSIVVNLLCKDGKVCEKVDELATMMNINPLEWEAMQKLRSGIPGVAPTPDDDAWVLFLTLVDLWVEQEGKLANVRNLVGILNSIGCYECADKIPIQFNPEMTFITKKSLPEFLHFLNQQPRTGLVWVFPLNKDIQNITRSEERETILVALNEIMALEAKNLIISGHRGSGKEELLMSALDHKWQLGRNSPHIFWVKAENAHNVWTFIVEVAKYLKIPLVSGFHSQVTLTLVQIVAEIEKHLLLRYNYVEPSIQTLIIFSGVETLFPELVEVLEALQTLNVVSTVICVEDGSIFDGIKNFKGSKRYHVPPAGNQEAVEFLRSLRASNNAKDFELCELLEFNFSALQFAADFMKAREITVEQYIAQFRDKIKGKEGGFDEVIFPAQVNLLMDGVTPDEKMLIEILSFIEHNVRVRRDDLKRFYNLGNPAGQNFEETLSTLMNLGILRIEIGVDEGWLYPKNISTIAKCVRTNSDGAVVSQILKNMNLSDFKERNPVVKILVLWYHAVERLSKDEVNVLSPISEQISDHLIALREFTFDCFVFSRENVHKMGDKLGPDHLQVTALEHNLACAIRYWGKWEESVDLFRKVYDKFLTIEGSPHGPYCIITMRNLADTLSHLKKYDEAADWRSLQVDLLSDEGEILAAKGRLAEELILGGKIQEGKEVGEDALINWSGEKTVEFFGVKFAVGRGLRKAGKPTDAILLLEEGLKSVLELVERNPEMRIANVIDGMRMELVYSKAMVGGVRGMAGLLKAQDEVFLGPLGWKM
ncbi:uncharacterized protein LOC110849602 [Folsomia candida]|uniref:uncharacterized protein LOC110849602 n=1 Tax=Folsomia candida TaxID=158441 RepID=UPI00160528DB|nr:uncharacterized protein LOC110849602 [Folsomia candida]XP_035708056.1 uncharacterized protein LOC110849602 [Folsomia candida]